MSALLQPVHYLDFGGQTPSPQQKAYYSWVAQGKGSAELIAVAGAGKTTTLVNGCRLMTGSVAAVAYNKKIATEMENKLIRNNLKHVRCGTAHSFGFSAWRYQTGGTFELDEQRKWQEIEAALSTPVHLRGFVKKLVSLAKQRAVGTRVAPDNAVSNHWMDIVDHFDLGYELADETSYETSLEDLIAEGIIYARKALDHSCKIARDLCDFDDLIYMPLKSDGRMWQNDWLLVDEAQDTNPARRALYRKMLKPGGRAVFVGDPGQAIYGFTGADNDSLELLRKEFGCSTLPLTVTFRCPKSVVTLAKTWVSHIESHPNNGEGSVTKLPYAKLLADVNQLKSSDAILCRNTRPLVELAFALIRKGKACHVEGKEIGRGLIALTNRWKLTGLEALRNKLTAFMDKEVKKLLAKGKEQTAAGLSDRVGTLLVIAEAMPVGSNVADLRLKIESMFADTPDGKPADNLTLSTVHKSKGREWKNVYLLGRNKYMPSNFARQPWQMQQEDNLCYVAVTRAMENLIEVEV